MWCRVYRKHENKEILFNTDHISKIDVTYLIPDGKVGFDVSLEEGMKNPEAKRLYTFMVGGDIIKIAHLTDDPVTAALEEIYKKATKGNG
jgi:hypothetical protein